MPIPCPHCKQPAPTLVLEKKIRNEDVSLDYYHCPLCGYVEYKPIYRKSVPMKERRFSTKIIIPVIGPLTQEKYTTNELAKLFGKHKNMIREYKYRGLKSTGEKGKFASLIYGKASISEFIDKHCMMRESQEDDV